MLPLIDNTCRPKARNVPTWYLLWYISHREMCFLNRTFNITFLPNPVLIIFRCDYVVMNMTLKYTLDSVCMEQTNVSFFGLILQTLTYAANMWLKGRDIFEHEVNFPPIFVTHTCMITLAPIAWYVYCVAESFFETVLIHYDWDHLQCFNKKKYVVYEWFMFIN